MTRTSPAACRASAARPQASASPETSLGLHRVAAELVAQRRKHLRPVRVVLSRTKARQKRQRDDWRRDVVVDRLLDRPATLAGVGDEPLEIVEVLAVRAERPPGQL